MKQELAGKMLVALIALLSYPAMFSGKDIKIVDSLKGVANSELHLYERKGPNWTCLDGSVTIPYEAINDDYCDCADGSDEPGTSACPNGRFHCRNEGHIPASISSSRVNDGVCDPECCDGSDEYDGKIECPNVCEEVGKEYRKKVKELNALREQGAKKKLEYIDYGKKLKEERKNSLEILKGELAAVKLKVEEKEAALKKIKQSEASSDSPKNKEHAERIKKYQERIKRLKDHADALHEDVETLLKILKDMKDGHNPNYHDMAVKSAITAYDEFLEEYNRESDDDVDDALENDKDEEYTSRMDEYEVPQILDPEPSLWGQYIELLRISANEVLEFLGLKKYSISQSSHYRSSVRVEPGTSKELKSATEARNKAEEERKTLEKKIEDLNNKLSNDYGLQEEFSKLDGECFEYDSGDSKEDPNYYTKQIYDHGARCWNGPERSVKLFLECGAENKILSVSEPEKCEYHVRMKTPATCPDNVREKIHDEL
ncbi:6391_t:CDS:10 [Acaulospora colombiana]|uniref:6391_t:CDS:1 n=1 Tax=Acaulospora colombiana TaxID=27376 RepID=A0ACA9L2G7_9GLOM|nr:6391_t:CDS:10 [Acaulospora colombiana]